MEDNQILNGYQVLNSFLFLCFPTYSVDGKCLFQQVENQSNNITHVIEQGQSSESLTNICSSADPPQGQDSDTSLKLG